MKDNRIKAFVVLGLFMLATAAFTTYNLVTTMAVTRFGPFFNSQVAFDSLTGGQPGGMVRIAIVGGTDSLKIGDVVYWSDTNKVTKSATLANYSMIAGVVVGGIRHSNRTSIAAADVGTVTAIAGQQVVICKVCRTWMQSSNNAVLIAGRRILPSDSIAGRFDSSLTASVIDTFYRMIGRTVTAAPALGTALVDVNIK
jgi:hypothetical protein